MERELFSELSTLVAQAAPSGSIRVQFSDSRIVLVYLWAVHHDRPVSWGCRRGNWPLWARRHALPSEPTMSRRLRSESVQTLLDRVERISQPPPADDTLVIDSKPLPVGEYSKDRHARTGYAAGSFARGYKLHLICDLNRCVHAWDIASMNVGEPKLAHELIDRLNVGGFWLVGDSAYDSNELHEHADRLGLRLIAPRKKRGRGLGNRRHSPSRLRSITITEGPRSQLNDDLIRKRDSIERFFGNLTTYGGGLSPLPAWVRTPRRVRRWVQGKLILNALRIRQRARRCA